MTDKEKVRASKLWYVDVVHMQGPDNVSNIVITVPGLTKQFLHQLTGDFPELKIVADNKLALPVSNDVSATGLAMMCHSWHDKVAGALIAYVQMDEEIPGLPKVDTENMVPMPPVKPPRPECTLHLNEQPEPVGTLHGNEQPCTVLPFLKEDSRVMVLTIIPDGGYPLTEKHIKEILKLYPDARFMGNNEIHIPLVGETREEKEEWTLAAWTTIQDFVNSNSPGIEAKINWAGEGDNAWSNANDLEARTPRLDKFLTQRNTYIPPRTDSPEWFRQAEINFAIDSAKGENQSVDETIDLLKKHLENLDSLGNGGVKNDPAIAALVALERVRQENRKKFWRKIYWTVAMLVILGLSIYGAGKFYLANVTLGNYTVVTECKVPFGDGQLTGQRHRTYSYQSFLGYRVGKDNETVTEKTEVKLPGDNLTILGYNDSKEKWWRMSYSKGDTGTAILKLTDKYWFVGDKSKTALVTYEDFCH